ncbi:hypothetical protein [Conyzicola sp.]|uniref:hypothetical protein n=1 Tax=Conyzicola sp. TaxID=1969404 RepID=UPI003989B118
MLVLQQVPVSHLAAHEHGVSDQQHAHHSEAETSGSPVAHVELETAHDFDDGEPADTRDCCTQTVEYVSAPTTVVPALTVHPHAAAVPRTAENSGISLAATAAPPHSRSLIQLSLQQV